jgi:cysteinyl-tRNA synthetase
MRWPSPWGEGFPGWHLECSAMSTKYLGEQFDIHGGGMDLKFPHHESEIAQNTACVGHGPVKYWMHSNMLTVNGTKMSKSLGNSFLPLELVQGAHPLLEQGYSPMTVRFFMMQSHYASTLDFSNEALKAAEKGFKRMMSAVEQLPKIKSGEKSSFSVEEFRNACYAAMNDDFNCPILVASLFEGVKYIHLLLEGKETISAADLKVFTETIQGFVFDVLGFRSENENGSGSMRALDTVMKMIIEMRKKARESKDWASSDAIRDQLKEAGIVIKDTKEGVEWNLE